VLHAFRLVAVEDGGEEFPDFPHDIPASSPVSADLQVNPISETSGSVSDVSWVSINKIFTRESTLIRLPMISEEFANQTFLTMDRYPLNTGRRHDKAVAIVCAKVASFSELV